MNQNDDLISRAEVWNLVGDMAVTVRPGSKLESVIKRFSNAIDSAPAVDAVPVVHAQWNDNGNEILSCSRCATWFPKERVPYMLYCGYCGARMDGGSENG